MSYNDPNYGGAPPPPYGGAGYGPPPGTTVIVQSIGNCPSCRQGNLVTNMTCLGVCCAIVFFPIGLVCLFLLTEQRCPVCGYTTS